MLLLILILIIGRGGSDASIFSHKLYTKKKLRYKKHKKSTLSRHEHDWQVYPVHPYSAIYVMTIQHDRGYFLIFASISLTADGPQRARLPISPTATLLSCPWSLRIFPSLLGSRLTIFYRDARSALLQLVNQWLNFTYSRSHAFRYGIELTTSALIIIIIIIIIAGVRGYLLLIDHSGDEGVRVL